MNAAFPALPLEITDLIIDSIGQNVVQRDARVALQACSLVCRSFRKRSQHYLFSKIVFRKTRFDTVSQISARITALRAILYNCIILPPTVPASGRIIHHIKDVEISLSCTVEEAYTILRHIDVAKVLFEFCKDKERGLRRLFLNMQGCEPPVDWERFDPLFIKSLSMTLVSPFFTTLCLSNIRNVPSFVLGRTKISNISFHMISTRIVDPRDVRCEYHLGSIEVMDIDPSFAISLFLKADDPERTSFRECLSRVRELRFSAPAVPGFVQMINPLRGTFKSLQILKLVLADASRHPRGGLTANVPYADLPLLRSLGITMKGAISTTKFAPLKDLKIVLYPKTASKSLATIRLDLFIESQYPWKDIHQFFPNEKLWKELDQVLNHKSFDSLRTVYLDLEYHLGGKHLYLFNETTFLHRCHGYLSDIFPSLALSSLISIVPSARFTV
ncbi:hypothetical protein HYPSUDRAFT_522324 [Hypholoma sublateritium FD-334 SS-4]|uniref:F-box domain-containing protein n=1 Tax=Hypholoma sublateritium (strain FD-334 SS-4) TaxID=945553 RepID=A0A0D2PFF9_HYPSF|nr:hypothetical protein HYPSUDRAFT_522324 [Hypholoma sublateritium FD-334 SS-4]